MTDPVIPVDPRIEVPPIEPDPPSQADIDALLPTPPVIERVATPSGPPESTKQMALTRDTAPGGFMERLQALIAVTAGYVLIEERVPYHQSRAMYAQRVIQNPQQQAQIAAPLIVMGPAIIEATVYDSASKTSQCTASDEAIQLMLFDYWNVLGGVDTPGEESPGKPKPIKPNAQKA